MPKKLWYSTYGQKRNEKDYQIPGRVTNERYSDNQQKIA